jgi:hypothetical protein
MDGMEDEEEIGNVGNEHESMGSECKTDNGNSENTLKLR